MDIVVITARRKVAILKVAAGIPRDLPFQISQPGPLFVPLCGG